MTVGPSGEAIGHRIRSAREVQLLSRADLAERSGVSKAGIHHLERGLSARPRRRTIEKIAAALGVEVETILGDVGTEAPKAEAPPSQRSLFNGFEEERRSPLSPWAEYVRQRAERIRHETDDPKSNEFRDVHAGESFAKTAHNEASDLFVLLGEEISRDPYKAEPQAARQEVLSAVNDFRDALIRAIDRAESMKAVRKDTELGRRREAAAAVADIDRASARLYRGAEIRGA